MAGSKLGQAMMSSVVGLMVRADGEESGCYAGGFAMITLCFFAFFSIENLGDERAFSLL